MDELSKGLSSEDRATLEAAFSTVRLGSGTVVSALSSDGRALALVTLGAVDVEWDGETAQRFETGALINEIALFDQAWRDSTLRAVVPTELQVLTPERYAELRASGHPAAWRLEQRVVASLLSRIRRLAEEYREVARRAKRVESRSPKYESPGLTVPIGAGRLKASLVEAWSFAGVSEAAVGVILPRLSTRRYGKGDILLAANSRSGGLYLLTRGVVDAFVPIPGEGQARLASLEPGELIAADRGFSGDDGLFQYEATDDTVVLGIDRSEFDRLAQRRDGVGSALRVATIRSLGQLLMRGHATLTLARLLAERQSG